MAGKKVGVKKGSKSEYNEAMPAPKKGAKGSNAKPKGKPFPKSNPNAGGAY